MRVDVGGRKWLIGSPQRFFCLDCSAFHFFRSLPSTFLYADIWGTLQRRPWVTFMTWIKNIWCSCTRTCARLHVDFTAVGFPSGPQVVVKFIFLSIVSHWDIKELLFVDQRGGCRLLAGPEQERSSSPPHLPFSPFVCDYLCWKSALPQQLCLDFERLSVVAPHFVHLRLVLLSHRCHILHPPSTANTSKTALK